MSTRLSFARIEHVSPDWFVPVMGWTGLGLTWLRAAETLGDAARTISWVCAGVASLMAIPLILIHLWRAHQHPAAFMADVRHPIRFTFWSALPIAMVLLAALYLALTARTSLFLEALWWLGAIGEWACLIWALARWTQPQAQHAGLSVITPVIFLPLVGHALVPWAGVPLGHATYSAVQLGIGLFMWPMGLVMLLLRLLTLGPLPVRMAPTWFILMVPPSALALSLNLWQPPQALLWGFWGMGLTSLMWALTHIKTIMKIDFDLPHWGMSFPLAAFTSMSWMMSQKPEGQWLQSTALILLAITHVVILWLSWMTLRGLWDGDLLRPETQASMPN
jgi:tellurite resistance protein